MGLTERFLIIEVQLSHLALRQQRYENIDASSTKRLDLVIAARWRACPSTGR
jgi:hypothetical protein